MYENEELVALDRSAKNFQVSQQKKVSWRQSGLLLLIISLIGGFFVYSSFAAVSTQAVNDTFQYYLCTDGDIATVTWWANEINSNPPRRTLNDLAYALSQSTTYKNRYGLPCSSNGIKSASDYQGPAYSPYVTQSQSLPTGRALPGGVGAKIQPSQPTTTNSNSRQYIEDSFLRLLCRKPTNGDFDTWIARLDTNKSWTKAQFEAQLSSTTEAADCKKQGGQPKPVTTTGKDCSVANDKQNSSNTTNPKNDWSNEHYITHLYAIYLSRGQGYSETATIDRGTPTINDPNFTGWVKQLDSCAMTRDQVENAIKNSPAAQKIANDKKAYYDKTVKPLKDAYMKLFLAAYEKEGHVFRDHGLGKGSLGALVNWESCNQSLADYKSGRIDMVWDVCFEGVGLPAPSNSLAKLLNEIKLKLITVEQAIAQINSKKTITCEDIIGASDNSCQTHEKFWSNPEDAALFAQNRVTAPLRNGNTATTFSSPSTSKASSGASTSDLGSGTSIDDRTDMIPPVNPLAQGLQNAIDATQPVTAAADSLAVCTTGQQETQECAQVPVNDTHAADINDRSVSDSVLLNDDSNCNSAICQNEYNDHWNDGGATSNTELATNDKLVSNKDMVDCVDKYQTVSVGDSSVCVKIVRIYLWLSDYLDSAPISNKFDNDLLTAVRLFQSDQKLKRTDGVVTKETWDKLKEIASKGQQLKKATAGGQQIIVESTDSAQRRTFAIIFATCLDRPNLKLGDKGDCVKRIQQILTLVQKPILGISSVYDTDTQNTVRDFQTMHGLNVTGEVNRETWQLLEVAAVPRVHKSPFQAASGSLINAR